MCSDVKSKARKNEMAVESSAKRSFGVFGRGRPKHIFNNEKTPKDKKIQ